MTLHWACRLVVVVELVCLSDPKSYAGRDLVPGGINRAGLVEGRDLTKESPWSSRLGVGR